VLADAVVYYDEISKRWRSIYLYQRASVPAVALLLDATVASGVGQKHRTDLAADLAIRMTSSSKRGGKIAYFAPSRRL
jgi:hypothetical protein